VLDIIFSIKRVYINIKKISITPSLCNNAALYWQYGCTQPKKRRRTTKKKKPRYSDKFLVVAALTPPRQLQKSPKATPTRREQCTSAVIAQS
jgi:hypothetical protein